MRQQGRLPGLFLMAAALLVVVASFLVACRAAPTPSPTPAPRVATPAPAPTPTPTPLPKVVWDMPFIVGSGHWNYDPFIEFIKELERRTNGGFVIQPHPSSSLYGLFDISKVLIEGKVQIASTFVAANTWDIVTALSILEMPILISPEKGEEAVKTLRPWAEKLLDRRGLMVFGTEIWPRQIVYTADRPLRRVEDWKGMKIRVYNKPGGDMARLLGASPVTIPTAEVYVALQRKVADGLITSIGNIPLFKLDEVVKYINDWGYVAQLPGFVSVNKKAWASLPEPYQKAFQGLYQEMDMDRRVKQASAVGVENSLAQGRKAGMELVEPPATEIARARETIRPVWKEWLAVAGDEGREGLEILFNAGILTEPWWR